MGGRHVSGIHDSMKRNARLPNFLDTSGTLPTSGTHRLPSEARLRPSGAPGRRSMITSVSPACH